MDTILYGNDEPLPERIPLRAGKLTLLYEAGNLRYIRLGDREVLRMVYSAVRDHNWLTVPGRIENEERDIHPDSFRISYDCYYEMEAIRFRARYVLEGFAEDRVTCRMEGEALTSFRKNRIGFCLHHAVREMMGVACTITHSDGTSATGPFPEKVSPHQPFKNIQEMTWPVAEGCRASIRFTGDVFETEDQRNWTDGSYKTYCTPLEKPFPVTIGAGEKVSQAVSLHLEGNYSAVQENFGAMVFSVVAGEGKPFPAVGMGHAVGSILTPEEVIRLKALHLHHYRVDVPLHEPGWEAGFAQALTEARKLDLPLEAALFFGPDPAAEAFAFTEACHKSTVPLKSLIVLHRDHKATPLHLLPAVVNLLHSRLGNEVFIGGGTDAFFAELNRARPIAPELCFLSFSVNPQVHATDALSLVENLEAQAFVVETARNFAGGKPVFVSPVTLKRRYNPDATGEQPATPPGELPWNVDARQPSLFAAAWTLGSLGYLGGSGAASLTYYETTGMRGVLLGERPPTQPAGFRAVANTVYPVYFVLREVLGFFPVKILPIRSSHPLLLTGMVLENGQGKHKMILANSTNQSLHVSVDTQHIWVAKKELTRTNYLQLAGSPDSFYTPEAWQPVEAAEELWFTLPSLATLVAVTA